MCMFVCACQKSTKPLCMNSEHKNTQADSHTQGIYKNCFIMRKLFDVRIYQTPQVLILHGQKFRNVCMREMFSF